MGESVQSAFEKSGLALVFCLFVALFAVATSRLTFAPLVTTPRAFLFDAEVGAVWVYSFRQASKGLSLWQISSAAAQQIDQASSRRASEPHTHAHTRMHTIHRARRPQSAHELFA